MGRLFSIHCKARDLTTELARLNPGSHKLRARAQEYRRLAAQFVVIADRLDRMSDVSRGYELEGSLDA